MQDGKIVQLKDSGKVNMLSFIDDTDTINNNKIEER